MKKFLSILLLLALASPVQAGKMMLLGAGAGAAAAAFTPASLTPRMWIEPSNASTVMNQSNTGGGTASGNGNPVCFINDLSGNGFTLVSLANNATCPVLTVAGAKKYITLSNTNATMLTVGQALGSYTAGVTSWFVAVKAGLTTAGEVLMGDTSDAFSNIPIYTLDAINNGAGTAADGAGLIRPDNQVDLLTRATVIQINPWDTTNRVYGIIDNGTTLTPYLNSSTGGTPITYTARAGATMTAARFTLGDLYRPNGGGTSGINWDGRVYSIVVVNRVLNSTEIGNLVTYMTGLF